MATVSGKMVTQDAGYVEYRWEGLTSGDDGSAVSALAKFPEKTVIINGTFDTHTVSIQGSHNGTDWVNLHSTRIDSSANADLSGIGAGAIEGILENPRFIRPLVNSTTGTPDIDVIVVASKRI